MHKKRPSFIHACMNEYNLEQSDIINNLLNQKRNRGARDMTDVSRVIKCWIHLQILRVFLIPCILIVAILCTPVMLITNILMFLFYEI